MVLLDAPDVDQLPYEPERHVRWSDDARTVHYAGWETAAPGAEVDCDGLVAVAGNPRLRGATWPSCVSTSSAIRAALALGDGTTTGLCDAYAVARIRPGRLLRAEVAVG